MARDHMRKAQRDAKKIIEMINSCKGIKPAVCGGLHFSALGNSGVIIPSEYQDAKLEKASGLVFH